MTLDEVAEEIERHSVVCPDCRGKFGEPQRYLTMFQTTIGPYSGAVGYGRPEAAQNIFVEFNRLYTTARESLPFGCIQIGHALRNEISPRQGLIRLREFTIADLEFFFDPEEPSCDMINRSGKRGFTNSAMRNKAQRMRRHQQTSPSAKPLTKKSSAPNGKPSLWQWQNASYWN